MGVKEFKDTLEKKYKESSVFAGDSKELNIERVGTGSLGLDRVLGGGLPKGKLVVFYGHEMTGKTSVALLCMKNQKKVAFVDVEKSYDPEWAKKLGLNTKDVLVIRPSSGETAFDIVLKLLESEFDVVVIDSIAGLVPLQELQREFKDAAPIASQARLINLGIRRVNLANKKTCLVFINQIREKIGVLYGSPEKMPGGQAIYFVPHVRLRFRKGEWLQDASKRIGIEVRVLVEKNKYGECQRDIHFNLYWDGFIDNDEEKIRLMLEDGQIKQEGSWYSWKGKRVQGKEELLKIIKQSK